MSAPRQRPWSKADLQLLGTKPDREVARRTGRTLAAVQGKRLKPKIKAWLRPSRKDEPRDPETTRLRFGPYVPPRARPGSFLFCERRGTVMVGDYSDGPIPWPIARLLKPSPEAVTARRHLKGIEYVNARRKPKLWRHAFTASFGNGAKPAR